MPQFPFKTPTLAEYKQNQEYYDRLYEGLREIWYNHNSAVPGFVELPEDCVPRPPTVNQASSSRAGPNPNSPTMHCDKQLGRDCNKACCKPTPKAQGRRVTIATASDEENGVVTDTEGNITDSSNRVVKGKMTAKGKGKDKAVQTESENEPSAAQTDDDASTDAETSVLSFVACLKDPNWSLSEDCRLRSMKEAGETWTFISDSLCKTKDDVRARWKILQNMSETKTRKSTVANKWHKGARNLKVAKENQEAKARAKAKTSGKDVSSADEAKDESDDDSSLFRYGDREKREQMKYLQEHVYGAMYPPYIHPQPDAYLGKRDCALLATIDSKYKRSRWLEMQANFYNVTGRMVPLESLKARCERAEAEKTERSKTRELERRMNKVEDWIAKQEREKSADSEDSEDSDDTDESDNSDDSDDPEDSGDSDE
ncbi:hypothetical protein AU210_005901 [Fusarium oxysporum f. sp. radicis-cucumerinum]|uniref:Myb-like domain-containing protein n=1 Tax=Fusarium oxysporum f. sp. radicis-cucumerinum TaxID=327505 RepID=A0A2H3HHP6_FUSOX|nr:hypothetical protein AU210_005901 [Fusarium oxysporum f. sp. radicis-cucumerinum]